MLLSAGHTGFILSIYRLRNAFSFHSPVTFGVAEAQRRRAISQSSTARRTKSLGFSSLRPSSESRQRKMPGMWYPVCIGWSMSGSVCVSMQCVCMHVSCGGHRGQQKASRVGPHVPRCFQQSNLVCVSQPGSCSLQDSCVSTSHPLHRSTGVTDTSRCRIWLLLGF